MNSIVIRQQNIGHAACGELGGGSRARDDHPNNSCTKVVGTTGFEPATSRTPSVRATRLRHVPTGGISAHLQTLVRAKDVAFEPITRFPAASRTRAANLVGPAALCG